MTRLSDPLRIGDVTLHDRLYRAPLLECAGNGDDAVDRLIDHLANRVQSYWYDFEPAWNADLCRTVRDAVSVPVLCEGGIRERPRIDRLLGDACDAVGMARPFYAEPELPARLLADGDAGAVCASCNNCAVPQVTGAPGVCRTPTVLDEVGKLRKAGAYDRERLGK